VREVTMVNFNFKEVVGRCSKLTSRVEKEREKFTFAQEFFKGDEEK